MGRLDSRGPDVNKKLLGDVVREGDWLHTGDIFLNVRLPKKQKTGRKPDPRLVRIEKIVYHDDLTRSFVLAPTNSLNSNLYRTMTSEVTLRRFYRRINTNEERVL